MNRVVGEASLTPLMVASDVNRGYLKIVTQGLRPFLTSGVKFVFIIVRRLDSYTMFTLGLYESSEFKR